MPLVRLAQEYVIGELRSAVISVTISAFSGNNDFLHQPFPWDQSKASRKVLPRAGVEYKHKQ